MAEKIFNNVVMKQKSDTTQNWSTNNPILKLGQIGFDSDLKKIKIGDGVSNWNSLEYFSFTPTEVTNKLNNKADKVHKHTNTDITGLGDLATLNNVDESKLEISLAGKINGKADISSVYKKSETYSQQETKDEIKRQVAELGKVGLKISVVETLPEASTADTNTIYLIAKQSNNPSGNIYTENIVVQGKWEQIGDTAIDLSEYAKTTEVTQKISELSGEVDNKLNNKVDKVSGKELIQTELITKLQGIEANAQVNKIDGVLIGTEQATLSGKNIQIPIATNTKLGVIKTDNTSISITAEGVLSVNQVNIQKLQQQEDDVLILDGGSSIK